MTISGTETFRLPRRFVHVNYVYLNHLFIMLTLIMGLAIFINNKYEPVIIRPPFSTRPLGLHNRNNQKGLRLP